MAKLDLIAIENLSAIGGYSGRIYVSDTTAATLLAAFAWYGEIWNWRGAGAELTSDEIDRIDAIAGLINQELQMPHAGEIIMDASFGKKPGALLCDGATYDRVDYPLLYAAIHGSYKLGPDTFKVPDMIDNFVKGTEFDLDVTGGQSEITIDETNLPSDVVLSVDGPTRWVIAPSGGTPVRNPTSSEVPIDITPPFINLRFFIITGQ